MKKYLLAAAALAILAVPAIALAQDPATILAARRAGQIGERFDGYIGLVAPSASAELRRQVAAINIRRRSLYSNLAARRGVSPEEVGITAACSLLRRVSAGEYYLHGQGGWRRLAAGQSAAPSYCG
ncbi:MAG: YdbL family protein [Pseudomonadota bacterium]|nr:YdbL family protein [Pseudomonadota bacterium]